jgi:hydroxymethylglutaryl-CoA reductase
MTGVETARELAGLMAAVGLAQNFAALQALATTGIQAGHMRLHARSRAATTGCAAAPVIDAGMSRAAGKVILLGEHAAVYGKHALALPIPDAVAARVRRSDTASTVSVPARGLVQRLDDTEAPLSAMVIRILRALDTKDTGFEVELHTQLPAGMGLGASAAFAVAMIRAFASCLAREISDDAVNRIAFECEKLAHGTPSGVDNTLATYATPMLFRRNTTVHFENITLVEPVPLVIACSSRPGPTTAQVTGVRERRQRFTARYDALFDEIDAMSVAGAAALERADYAELGGLMNLCQGLLNAIGVSTAELEDMIAIARGAGATGAKLTGAGGGGSIVALCPGVEADVRKALSSAGFKAFELTAGNGRNSPGSTS